MSENFGRLHDDGWKVIHIGNMFVPQDHRICNYGLCQAGSL